MKKLITTCALLTTVSVVSFAQSKQTSHTMSFDAQPNAVAAAPAPAAQRSATATKALPAQQVAEKRAKAHQKAYGLTAEQYKGVLAAELDYAMQEQQIKEAGYTPGGGQVMQMGMGRDMRIKDAMTAEQYAKYEADKAKK